MLVKRLLTYTTVAIALFFACYYQHAYVVGVSEENLPFNLFDVYLFQAAASLLLVLSFELLASLTKEFRDQLGFIYLGAMALKIVLFCVIFRDVLFTNIRLSNLDSLSLLIPIFIFIFFEVVIISKILNRSA